MAVRTLLLALFVTACGGADSVGDHDTGTTDSVIGDPCFTDADCLTRCYTDQDKFPGGFCSVPCASDADCPSDTRCAGTEGGVCLFECPPFDCTFLGPGYRCDDKKNPFDQTIFVCIAD